MTPDTNKERADFEAWLDPAWSRDTFADDDGDTLYVEDWVQGAWMMFCHNRASLAAKAPAAPDWWRKRADEIELQVAQTGSPEAMRCYTDMRTLLQAAAPPAPTEQWLPIETAPESESVSFLLLVPGNGAADYLVVQVSKFEGNYYPDVMDCNVDWYSRVTKATHWMPLPPLPRAQPRGRRDPALRHSPLRRANHKPAIGPNRIRAGD